MSLFVCDVEADGPCPSDYSMLSFAAIRVDEKLDTFFESGPIKPISTNWNAEAINSIGLTSAQREENYVINGRDAFTVLLEFDAWIKASNLKGRPIFISDNPAFDWMFICWYFHHFLHVNPFGYSARRIGDIYCGLVKDMRARWKHLRKTQHTHNPVQDAMGNAEVLLHMINNMELKT